MFEVKAILNVDYTNKNGKHVTGKRLGVFFEDNRWENGIGNDVIYCNGNIADDVKVGDFVKFLYNRFGNVEEVQIIA